MPKLRIEGVGTLNIPDDVPASAYDTIVADAVSKAGAREPVFGKDRGAGQTAFQRTARQRLADLQSQTGHAEAAQDIADAKGRFAGDLAKGAVLGAATLATGGLAAPEAIALMGGGGLLAGTAEQTAKAAFGSSDMPKSGKELAVSLGIDAALGAAGEGGARGLAYVGKAAGMKLLAAAAGRSAKAKMALESAESAAHDTVIDAVRGSGREANVTAAWQRVTDAMRKLPKGTGKVGANLAGDARGELGALAKDIESDLVSSAEWGMPNARQPLDAAIRIQSKISQMAHLAGQETEQPIRVAFRDASDMLKREIVSKLTPAEREAFATAKAITRERIRWETAGRLADKFVNSALGRMVPGGAGAAAGATYGYYRDHSISGAAKGAAAGLAASEIVSQAGPWLLQRVLANPNSRQLFNMSIKHALENRPGPAWSVFRNAVNTSGAGDLLVHWAEQAKAEAQDEQ